MSRASVLRAGIRREHSAFILATILVLGCDGSSGGADAGRPPPPTCFERGGCVSVLVVGPDTEPVACRLSVEGLDGTPSPTWGSGDHVGEWIGGHAVATGRFVVAAPCSFELGLTPGRYRLTASRGPAWSIDEAVVQVERGASELRLELAPAVDTAGFACADFHVHSAPSFDSDVPLDQRLVSALAEGLDAIAATDHDARGEWESPAAELGIGPEALLVLVGNEITPDQGAGPRALGHFNVYPVPTGVSTDAFDLPLGGADAVLANARALAPDAILQVNHPRWNEWIGYFTVIDFDAASGDGRRTAMSTAFDALEVYNGHELSRGGPTDVELNLRDWYALSSLGLRFVATGNSDTHRLARAPLGFPRTCVAVERAPGAPLESEALLRSLRAGAALVTSGPWIDARVDGVGLGGLVPMRGSSTLEVRVSAPAWAAVDRYAVVINGRVVLEREIGAVPYEDVVPLGDIVPLEVPRDAWLVVRAEGDAPLGIAAGAPGHPMRSLAFTNPIYLDADGDGAWTPPGL